jgi:hypothetical protein
MERPPAILNPVEAAKAEAILARPSNVPRGHEKLDDLKPIHREEVAPSPAQLTADRAWFFPGLAYCMMGMDRSLFELFSHGLGQAVAVTTHRTSDPVVLFDGVDVRTNPWFHTIQGIDPALLSPFCEYIETFRFTDPRKQVDWILSARTLRIADPFVSSTAKVGVNVVTLLPTCLSTRREVVVRQQAGLTLQPVVLGIRRQRDPA